MIVDANCAIGHWPFRRLSTTTADGLLRLLDRAGIERAVVTHTHGVFYRSPHESNAELHEAVRPHRDRLVPFACLSPEYAGWRDDLRQCTEQWEMRGLRIYPNYHRYDLAGAAASELLSAAMALDLAVSIGCAFEDPRQRHPLDTVPDVTEHQLGYVAHRFPRLRLLVTSAPLAVAEMVAKHAPENENVVFDTTGFAGPLSDAISGALRSLGPRRLLLGTHAPFKYPQVNLLRVRMLETDDATHAAILGGNALRLLGQV